ncbi:hypothetical protein ANFP_18030 [Acidithiobacillus ferrooxidans]|nr:hypothetical protein ANFP_18030 [Acidithiobacillus ferrooxidans]
MARTAPASIHLCGHPNPVWAKARQDAIGRLAATEAVFLSRKAVLQHQAIIDEGTVIAPIGIAVIEGEAVTQG